MALSRLLKAVATTGLLFLLLILFVLLSPIYLFRAFVSKVGRFKTGFTNILASHSAIFYTPNIDTNPSTNVGIGLEVAGSMNPPRILELLSNRMIFLKNSNEELLYPEFQQFPALLFGFPFWKWEKKFDIQEHIHFFPKTTDAISDDDAFSRTMEFLDKGLTREKSPWEIIVIEKKASFLLFFKFQHSLADGYAIFNALIKCCDVPTTLIRPVSKKLTWKQAFQRNLSILRSFFPKADAPLTAATQSLGKETSWDIPSAKMTFDRVYSLTAPIRMAGTKELSKRSGLSLSAAILTGVAGAVRRYLGKAGDDEGTQFLCNIPLPPPRHPQGLTNYLTSVDIELPLVDDPESRSQEIQRLLKETLTDMAPEKKLILCTSCGALPKCILSKLAMRFPPLCCSIFPGPKERVTFDVFPVVDMYFNFHASLVYSCLMTVCSYNGFFRILTNMDRNICKEQQDVERMSRVIEEEFAGMHYDSQ